MPYVSAPLEEHYFPKENRSPKEIGAARPKSFTRGRPIVGHPETGHKPASGRYQVQLVLCSEEVDHNRASGALVPRELLEAKGRRNVSSRGDTAVSTEIGSGTGPERRYKRLGTV